MELGSNSTSSQPWKRNFVDRLQSKAETAPEQRAFTYLLDGEDESVSVTYRQLDRQARAIAQRLMESGMSGERALLLFPPGLDFVSALLGCFYSNVVAVPAYPPRRNRNMQRIQAIANDAQAKLALTVENNISRVSRFLDDTPQLKNLEWFACDRMDEGLADSWVRPEIDADSLALLQYTSGSTGDPKGVMLTHENILHNCHFITESFRGSGDDTGMSWLPTYHDMGLIGGVLNPLFMDCTSILMSPTAFLQKPVRWLRAISKHRVTVSGGPNFAYDVCSKKVTAEEMVGLDLSSWTLAFNGAEPVRTATIHNFARKFASVGFRLEAFYPCYGMAESTLMMTGGEREARPLTRSFHGSLLDKGEVRSVETVDLDARHLVGCGVPPEDGNIAIVDAATRQRCESGRIGEIWVSSGSIGQGYLNKPKETADSFRARLKEDDGRNYLRTGDLGFYFEDQLFVTGRIKDLIIVRGVNRYPQDIELTVEHSDARLRTGAAAAFAVDMRGREQLIIVCEVERIAENNWDEVIGAIRRKVTVTHELPPDGIVLVRAGSIPKTSSGKIQRHACREGFLKESLMSIADWYAWDKPHNGNEKHVPSANATASGVRPINGSALKRVYEVVRDVAGFRAKELSPDTSIIELGLDSMERIEVANRLENAFGGVFSDSVLREMETCGEVAAAIQLHLGPAAARNKNREYKPAEYDIAAFPEYLQLKHAIQSLEAARIPNPFFSIHESVARDTTTIDGREYINFASYNYLGMSGDPYVTEAASDAARRYGTSCSASRVVSGERPLHLELERAIADFIGVPDALTFVGGHATNETTIGHLCSSGDLILHDSLAHNSILQGATLSGARRRQFPHNDWHALDALLMSIRGAFRRVLIVIEGVYSMDGDYPDLPGFIEIKRRHKAMLMIDEAHSIGTMGKTGRGIAEHSGVDPRDVDIWMGTLSKSFGSCGGYIAGSSPLVEYLKFTAPGFVYSVGLSPPNAAAALASIKCLMRQPERVARCQANSRHFLRLARQARLATGNSNNTPIIPVITGNSERALLLSQRLLARGVNVQPIMYPAVEESAARLRFFISSEHKPAQIEYTIGAIREEWTAIAGQPALHMDAAGVGTPKPFTAGNATVSSDELT